MKANVVKKNQVLPKERVEIEVTSEMIEAGTLEIAHYNPREDDAESAVQLIYIAMELARRAKAAPY
jgi:hypothetical protein